MLERFAPFIEARMRKNVSNSEQMYRFLSGRLVQRYFGKYKLLKLKKTVKYCYDRSPYYHEQLKNNNCRPEDIKSFSDMIKIPFTDSDDLQKPEQFLCTSPSEIIKIFSSSGTTGNPKKISFTRNDILRQASGIADGVSLLYGIDNTDAIRITYDQGYGMSDWGVRYILENVFQYLGATSVVTGCRLPADQEYELMKSHKISVLMGTPSYINALSTQLRSSFDLKSLNIKCILLGTEPLPSAIRKNIEEIWHTNVYQGYGSTEMGTSLAGECKEKNGMHITESDFHVEIVDPKTNEPLEDGEVGELIVTTLSRDGMPLLRYRTHDLGFIMPERCPCSLPFKKIKVKGRTDEIITIGSGDKLLTTIFDDLLFSIPSVDNYRITIERFENIDHLTVIVETKHSGSILKSKIEQMLMTIPEIRNGILESKTIMIPTIRLVKPNTIKKATLKAKRIMDKRKLYD